MKIKKYRIVTDRYLGYEVQVKYIFFPFWFQSGINTFASIEKAEQYILDKRFKKVVVKNNL